MDRLCIRSQFLAASVVGIALIGGTFVPAEATSGSLLPRHVRNKPAHSQLWPGLRSDLLIVKFVEGSEVRLRGGALSSAVGANLSAANLLLSGRSDLTVERLFSRPESALDADRAGAQSLSGRELADLNNYYALRLNAASVRDAEQLLDALNALEVVEIAYAEPRPEVARFETLLPTPNYEPSQDYIEAAPLGVNAPAAWAFPGGNGSGIKIIDVEIGWNWTHEDLPAPFYTGGPATYDDHGTAVIGEMVGKANGFGISGIANGAQIGGHSVLGTPTADVFDQVQAALDPGDVWIIELHCPGPESTGGGQDGFIALEWWQANYDAIALGSARGVICCQAAGNGAVNFDDAIYEGLFDREVRDSGSIIVGAAVGTTRQPEWFTNHGARVDLHGWGSSVVTTGYGDLQGGAQNQWYTSGFSGTSSATPIVTGSVVALQGAYKAATGGSVLPPGTIAQVLKDTGTPQAGSSHIGPRPNLAAAIPYALNDLGSLFGEVTTDGTTPLEGALIRIEENGAQARTDPAGHYELLATPGSWTVVVEAFGRSRVTTVVAIGTGADVEHDVTLTALATAALSGTVADQSGAPIEGALVTALGTPFAPVLSDAGGHFSFPAVPSGTEIILQGEIAGRAPDRARIVMTPFGVNQVLRLATPQNFEAANGGYTVNSGQWEWGVPTFAAGPSAHSGTRCWGTDLDAAYSSSSAHRLYTTTFDLTGMVRPKLAYWQWYSIWGPYDGGNVSISTNNGTSWTVIHPVGGYTDSCIDAFNTNPCAPGYAGSTGAWEPAVFDLSAYVNRTVRFRFWLQPWGYSNAAGWYFDDLAVFGETPLVDVADGPVAGGDRVLSVSPNPTAGSVHFELALASAGVITSEVFDVHGRRVRVVPPVLCAPGSVSLGWDGRDQAGRSVPPGVYFVRLARQGGAELARERVLIVR